MNLKRLYYSIFLSLLGLFFLALIALLFGSVKTDFHQLYAIFFGNNNSTLSDIIFRIRLPRVLLAIAVGGGLASAGAVLQAILKNPLAEPYILGVSSGGTFGAMISFLFGLSFIFTQLFSFTGALLVIFILLKLSNRKGRLIGSSSLLLTGVMLGAFFGAAILIFLTLMRENLQTAVFWLIGSLSFASPADSIYILVFSILISLFLSFLGFRLNLIAMGEEEAGTLGLNVTATKNIALTASGLLVGGIVSVSGVIGFVGMIVPHLIRIKFGFDNRFVIPLSFFAGAALLLISDTIARVIILPGELPVGAITALIGAPVFIYLLRKRFYLYGNL